MCHVTYLYKRSTGRKSKQQTKPLTWINWMNANNKKHFLRSKQLHPMLLKYSKGICCKEILPHWFTHHIFAAAAHHQHSYSCYIWTTYTFYSPSPSPHSILCCQYTPSSMYLWKEVYTQYTQRSSMNSV